MKRAFHSLLLWLASAASPSGVIGCHLELDLPQDCLEPEACLLREPEDRPRDSPAQMSMLTWNVQWFQHPERGPTDDALQFDSVLDVIGRSGATLVALQEVSDAIRFHELLERLPEYEGVVSEHTWPQQLALLYRPHEFALVASAPVVGLDDAGRPPLAVELQHTSGARAIVVVVHAKAGSTPIDYAHRQRFANGLAGRLASSNSIARVVLGDFNDRLTGSLVSEHVSPYEGLLADTGIVSPTAALEAGSEPSTIWGDTVDHILVDPAWLETSAAATADVLRDELLGQYPDFVADVSDHFPVRLRVADPRSWRLAPAAQSP